MRLQAFVCLSVSDKKPTYSYWAPVAAATRGFETVLFTASRGNNFVGGTYAPPSALGF